MSTNLRTSALITVAALTLVNWTNAGEAPSDLTQDNKVDRTKTYNLGATGLRGWIHTKPASHLDALQGRTTASSRQILVTHVGTKTPADGVLQVDDVILGIGDQPFSDDARKSIAQAIQDAEKETSKGVLKLRRWRAGKTETVQLKLKTLGSYSATAPYTCAKSQRILEEACVVLAKEPLEENLWGAISGLALLSTGKPEYLPKVQEFARKIAPQTLKLELKPGMTVWEWGYRGIFLCEYFLATGDQEVKHALTEYAVTLAKGQSLYGTFGHGISGLTPDGKLHGSIQPYGPVNEAGLIGNIAIVLGKKCGVNDPEIEPAIARSAGFFSYFTDKGTIPYGEHEPWPYHENNGKGSMTAVMFALQGKRTADAQFFAKMSTAGYRSRECGHTGQGFSYLWSALGANVGGPAAAAAFFKEASWHLDLVRRSDGSFTYDGDEQYGAGKTDDDTYFGKSSYDGLSPTACYVLTYAMPLKKLCITGKGADPTTWLSTKQVEAAITSGRFDLDRLKQTPQQLVAAFSDWSPVVRGWAAEELARRPEAKAMIPQLLSMADGKDVHVAQAACETLGRLRSVEALPILVRQLSHEDRWLRWKAAQAIRTMEGAAKPAIPDILKVLVKTAEPLEPIVWADPIQFAHGQLASALFQGQMKDAVRNADPKLLYPAIRVVLNNADGHARGTLRDFFENKLKVEDMEALAADIFAAVKTPCPADTMFGNEIRMGGFKALTKFKYKEGIEMGVLFAKTQGGHGSESRTGEIMQEIVAYGSAARGAIPELRKLIDSFNEQVKRGEYPDGPNLNGKRVKAVEQAIAAIEAAKDHPELRSIGTGANSNK